MIKLPMSQWIHILFSQAPRNLRNPVKTTEEQPFPGPKIHHIKRLAGLAQVLHQDGQIHEEITGIVHILHPLNTKDVLKKDVE